MEVLKSIGFVVLGFLLIMVMTVYMPFHYVAIALWKESRLFYKEMRELGSSFFAEVILQEKGVSHADEK